MAVKEDIKQVMHYKDPKGGYQKGSPLFEKQQALVAKTPVSTTMKCVIFLIFQYFIIYTGLFITQTVNKVRPTTLPRLERCLLCVTKTLYFAPMLCVLFLATRMRAVQLSQGMTEKYDLPQWWVKQAMIICSLAMCLQTVLAAVYYALLSKDPETKGGAPSPIEKGLNAARWLVIVCLYLGFMIVCVGVCTMPAPGEIWGDAGGPKVSPAVACTITLATFYFAVFFCVEVMKNVDEFLTPEGQRFGVLEKQTVVLRDVATTVDICPMLCILFLTARLRALQLDPKAGNPQTWAQTWFYVTSVSVFGLVVLCAVLGWLRRGSISGQEETRPATKASRVAEAVRALCMLILIVGAITILISVWMLRRKEGPTPSIPPSIKCVMIMAVVYFIVYTAVWFTNAMKRLRTRGWDSAFVANFSTFLEERAKAAIDFCPMLCILFLGTFMRALQITAGRGAPQPWAQMFMYVGATAVIIMTVARIDTMIFPAPQEGSPGGPKPPNRRVLMFCNAVHHVGLLLMHMAVVAVIVALFTMTPKTATGSGAMMNLSVSAGVI
jgi:cytochrome bd-type quinol oxidase subunit 2